MRSIVSAINDNRVVGNFQLIEKIDNLSDILIMVDHRVMVETLKFSGLPKTLWLGVCPSMHVGEIDPREKGLSSFDFSLDEFLCSGNDFVIDRFHSFFGERTCVFDDLLSDSPKTRIDGWIVHIGCLTIHDPTWTVLLEECRVFGIIGLLRLLFSIKVVEIAKELVKSMDSRQEFVSISQVIFSKLSSGVPLFFQ